jgi:hypothetical protein
MDYYWFTSLDLLPINIHHCQTRIIHIPHKAYKSLFDSTPFNSYYCTCRVI